MEHISKFLGPIIETLHPAPEKVSVTSLIAVHRRERGTVYFSSNNCIWLSNNTKTWSWGDYGFFPKFEKLEAINFHNSSGRRCIQNVFNPAWLAASKHQSYCSLLLLGHNNSVLPMLCANTNWRRRGGGAEGHYSIFYCLALLLLLLLQCCEAIQEIDQCIFSFNLSSHPSWWDRVAVKWCNGKTGLEKLLQGPSLVELELYSILAQYC